MVARLVLFIIAILCLAASTAQACTIIDPRDFQSPNPSNWAWVVWCPVDGNFQFRLEAFVYNEALPSGNNEVSCRHLPNWVAGDSLFQNGFEGGDSNISRVIEQGDWVALPSPPSSWSTQGFVIGTATTPGWYECTYVRQPDIGRHRFQTQQQP